jgi:hypothetical protein
MKGRVVFWYGLMDQDPCIPPQGVVYFKLFGQICQKCNDPNRFEYAMWYPEEVIKVVENIFVKVSQIHYGWNAGSLRKDRRSGKPSREHNEGSCEACRFGVCSTAKQHPNNKIVPIEPKTKKKKSKKSTKPNPPPTK